MKRNLVFASFGKIPAQTAIKVSPVRAKETEDYSARISAWAFLLSVPSVAS